METMRKPRAVLISDIHFNIHTLDLASQSLMAAMTEAGRLSVPLIIAGDMHDTKAIIRSEVANKLLYLFQEPVRQFIEIFLLIGNHCRENEKDTPHALNFLEPHVNWIINYPVRLKGWNFIPYQHNPADFKEALSKIPKRELVICHQGVQGANSGEYMNDPSAVPREWVQDYRIISGHYHRAQDIKCGRPQKGAVGLWSYVGNPYTLNFGEANDGPKGYQILYEDGLMQQVPLNLRKHVIVERTTKDVYSKLSTINHDDLLWVKVSGPTLELEKLNKEEIGKALIGHSNFKLDKMPTDEPTFIQKTDNQTDEQLMDELIDTSSEPDETKQRLKDLWREVMR